MPWAGLGAVARLWSASGDLSDFLGAPEWDADVAWARDLGRARLALVTLLAHQRELYPQLPRHREGWLEMLEQLLYRAPVIMDYPTAHTDWTRTISEYGQYPSLGYVDRPVHSTFDTPLTRVLRRFATETGNAVSLVHRVLGQEPLTEEEMATAMVPLTLPEAAEASTESDVEFDLQVVAMSGGLWVPLAYATRQLLALRADLATQLRLLRPILPGLASQLFELGVLGTAAQAVAKQWPATTWRSRSPAGAGRSGAPCLTADNDDGTLSLYLQTVPSDARVQESLYEELTSDLGGRPLRPDVWLRWDATDGRRAELVAECKYSSDPLYVASGVPEAFAYATEFGRPTASSRLFAVVGPDGVVTHRHDSEGFLMLSAASWSNAVLEMITGSSGEDPEGDPDPVGTESASAETGLPHPSGPSSRDPA